MDLDDEYHLALKRWTSAIVIWANDNLPANGYNYDRMHKMDAKLKELADKCVEKDKI